MSWYVLLAVAAVLWLALVWLNWPQSETDDKELWEEDL